MLRNETISRAQYLPLMFLFLALSSSWSQVSLGEYQSILLIPWKISIYASMPTLPIFPLGKRKDDCIKRLIVHKIAHHIYLIIYLLFCWSPFDNHLHGLHPFEEIHLCISFPNVFHTDFPIICSPCHRQSSQSIIYSSWISEQLHSLPFLLPNKL